MKICSRSSGGITVLDLVGNLDCDGAQDFETAVTKALRNDGIARVVLNLYRVKRVDVYGLGAMLAACLAARRAGTDLRIIGLRGPRLDSLIVVKLLTVYDLFVESEALVRLRPDALAELLSLADRAAWRRC